MSADKGMTKTQIHRALTDVRASIQSMRWHLDRGNLQRFEEMLTDTCGELNQLSTDLFDPTLGVGIRGEVFP